MVPEGMRVKRSKKIMAHAPAGQAFCAGCQSFRDLEDFGKGATTCRACQSAKTHAAMIEKTYGLDAAAYDALFRAQGGRCAICRARPKSKRLAVDHDHKTGAVRGLLCSICNHDVLGGVHDDAAIAWRAFVYLATPPARVTDWDDWLATHPSPSLDDAQRPSKPPESLPLVTSRGNAKPARGVSVDAVAPECTETHYRPAGSVSDPHGPGYWRVYVEDRAEVVPPF